MPAPLILAILLAFPALEIYLLVLAAHAFGFWLMAWLAAAAWAGFRLIRGERLNFARRMAEAVTDGRPMFGTLWASGSTILAGVLLIVPGLVSDALALVLLLLPRRRPPVQPQPASGPTVIDGEWRREDEPRPPLRG